VAHSAEELQAKILPKPQFFRMRVDTRDVGYTVFSEAPDKRDGYKGVLSVMASRTFPTNASSLEYHCEAFWAFKKDNSKFDPESYYSYWASHTEHQFFNDRMQQDKTWFNEIGTMALDPSLSAREPVRDEKGMPKKDAEGNIIFNTRPTVPTPENTDTVLTVTRSGDKRMEPVYSNKTFNWVIKPDMPAALPKALENVGWPRLVDLTKPASYAFVVFNAGTGKLGLRTLTVHGKLEMTINESKYTATEGWQDLPRKMNVIKLTDELDPGTTTLFVDESGKVLLIKTSDGTSMTPASDADLQKAWAHRLVPAGGSTVTPTGGGR
jgi:hypothetical protein